MMGGRRHGAQGEDGDCDGAVRARGGRYEKVGVATDGERTAVVVRQAAEGSTCDIGCYSDALALPKREGGYGTPQLFAE